MTDQNVRLNTRMETQRGDEALREANVLLANGLSNGAVGRAYYAAFHYARALLFSKGLETKSHRRVIQLVHLHFVRNGALSGQMAGLLAQLETKRALSDYRAEANFSQEEAKDALSEAEAFIRECRKLLTHST